MELDKIIVPDTTTINEAMLRLNETAMQILLVTDKQGKFLGTISDGDIRRGLLCGKKFRDTITTIANTSPLCATPSTNKHWLWKEAKKRKLKKIPLIDTQGYITSLIDIEPSASIQTKDNVAIIMAGGLGTRLRPLTNTIPKPLLPIADTPILETIIKHFCRHGYTRIYLAVNYKADMIKEYFSDGALLGANISYIEETERQGTAGALKLIDPKEITAPFFVMNGDLLTSLNLEQMLNYHTELDATATIGVKEYDFQVPYGVVKSADHYVHSIDEKPTYRFFVNAGIYILNPEVLHSIPQQTFIDMPDMLEQMFLKKQKVASFPIHEYWMDIGQIEDYKKANEEHTQSSKREHTS